MATTASYPAWEDIPPPPSAPQAGPSHSTRPPPPPPQHSLLPTWLFPFFTRFPLREFPAALPLQDEDEHVTRPTLYVAPGHTRRRGEGLATTTWTSADALCLRWQMDFLFRSQSGAFACKQILHEEAWGPKVDSLPFAQLPAHGGSNSRAKLVSSPARLLDAESLGTWTETRWPYEWEKVENAGHGEGGSSSQPYPSDEAKLEAELWTSLLEGKLMAAVLLAQMTSPSSSSTPQSRPLFSRLLNSHLTTRRLARQAHHIASLSSSTSVSGQANLSRNAGSWSSWLPSLNLSFDGPLSSSKQSGDAADEGREWCAWPEEWDEDAITEGGVEALRAVKGAMGKTEGGEQQWLLGASHPTSLDALLFALLHTILSLDATGNMVVQRLRTAINGEGSGTSSLAAWTKWVYSGWVKEREVEWQREQEQAA